MNSMVKPYLFRASLLAGIALLFGVLLSLLVYSSSNSVRKNAIDLVENRIPVLTSINQVIADLSEQERIIYEYYSTQQGDGFWQDFNHNKTTLQMHMMVLAKHQNFIDDLAEIGRQQTSIESIAMAFHMAMQLQENNWDFLRELLASISQIRRDMLPVLQNIEQKTKQAVAVGHKNTLTQMNLTHKMVIVYGISIVLLGAVVAWYIKQYVLTNAKNTRLALFTQHNPNPILSVNSFGELMFSNPACQTLLKQIGLNGSDVRRLIPADFLLLREQARQSKNSTLVLEQTLNNHILQININWLKAIDAYDLHIIDITERKLAEQKVNYLAFYVQETNLPNQYKLTEDVEQLIQYGDKFSFTLFEIHNFSRIVTAHGIEAATELVSVFSAIIAQSLPEHARLYQLNESQFAIIGTDAITSLAAQAMISKLLRVTEKPMLTSHGEFFLDVNVGICLSPEHGLDFNTLFKNSHTALAMARVDVHNNVVLFKIEHAQAIDAGAVMLNNLRNALSLNELFLVFQPQLDLQRQQITGLETLVRWRRQEKIISPVDFIPLAEQSGLIVPIGEWILTQACLLAKKLVTQGQPDLVVAVNVSPRQFSHPGFVQCVIRILADTQLPAKNLELEITEGVFMHNELDMLAVLNQLKSLGLQLSIDDFGTGYSSLSYLKQFPIDKLKIDQSFVRNCHSNEEDKALIKTIVALGKNLGLSLIAEGVEEAEHVSFLREIDCDEIQGYWFSRPLEEGALLTFLQQHSASMAS